MNKKERIYEKTHAAVLQRIARSELDMAALVIASGVGRSESILFLLQQCIEKSLKAALISQGKPVPFVHDLAVLVDRFSSENQPPGGFLLGDLTVYATVRRYEEGPYSLNKSDLDEALSMTTQVLAWTDSLLERNE